MTVIPDESMKYLILGLFRGQVTHSQFPIYIDHVEDNLDEKGEIQTFTIVTRSGLRYTVSVDFEGGP